ncbi:DNA-binding response regulator [Algibacter lectus]|uniref:DNA-binding response regulator n=1 Tax=Algibacter lectus TaxID=221126 RepID=A0A090X527_9FLAO|nr:DNA-binding response regulator [Algibacter lectus]
MNTNIVIADDHPLMLRGLTDFLTNKGFNIIGSAEDGKAAYNLIIKLEPEIAILDIRMPFKTGLEIAEACKKHNLPTKIILITFDKEEEVYDQAIQSGGYTDIF